VYVSPQISMPSKKQFQTVEDYNAYFKAYRDKNRKYLQKYWREYKRKQKLKESSIDEKLMEVV